MGKEKGVSEGRMKKEGGTAGGKNEEKDIDYQSMVGIAKQKEYEDYRMMG